MLLTACEEKNDVSMNEQDIQRVKTDVSLPVSTTDVASQSLLPDEAPMRKPSLNVYCLDYSGSMLEHGHRQLKDAIDRLFALDEEGKRQPQASDNDVHIVIPFNQDPLAVLNATGSGQFSDLMDELQGYRPKGGTDIYTAASRALDELAPYDLDHYQVAIIFLTDGTSDGNYNYFRTKYETFGYDIPIFSLILGQADQRQMDELAMLSGARVFHEIQDLLDALQGVEEFK